MVTGLVMLNGEDNEDPKEEWTIWRPLVVEVTTSYLMFYFHLWEDELKIFNGVQLITRNYQDKEDPQLKVVFRTQPKEMTILMKVFIETMGLHDKYIVALSGGHTLDPQTETMPYVYNTPTYGYAQSPFNAYNPYIPGAMIGGDGSYVVAQQYYMSSYENGATSPAYFPIVLQSGSDTFPSGMTDQLMDMAASIANRVDASGPNRNSSSAAATFTLNPGRVLKIIQILWQSLRRLAFSYNVHLWNSKQNSTG